MGGDIRVESELGKGSTFYCTFEFLLQKDTAPDLPWAVYSSNVRILVIDDTLRGEIICKHTGTKNCENIAGDKALEAFFSAQQTDQAFDIVIIDSQLHSTSPIDLLHIIQQKKFVPRFKRKAMDQDSTSRFRKRSAHSPAKHLRVCRRRQFHWQGGAMQNRRTSCFSSSVVLISVTVGFLAVPFWRT